MNDKWTAKKQKEHIKKYDLTCWVRRKKGEKLFHTAKMKELKMKVELLIRLLEKKHE